MEQQMPKSNIISLDVSFVLKRERQMWAKEAQFRTNRLVSVWCLGRRHVAY